MADVFLSYAREDRAVAEKVAQNLSALGLETFWDTEIPPGKTWADYIEGKLTACRAVIVLWSQHSTKSQWVREEARMGRDSSKLIPALIDGTPAPFGFGEVQAADLSNWNGQSNHPEWTRFANAVAQAVGAPLAAPRPAAAFMPAASAGREPHMSGVSPLDYIKKCLRLFADGKGRARRAEYWWWTLGAFALLIVAAMLDAALFTDPFTGETATVLSGLVGLALIAPTISVMSRRFHDVGLNGWLVAGIFGAYVLGFAVALENDDFGALIVVLTGVAALIVTVLPSKPGPNQYGPNPKGV